MNRSATANTIDAKKKAITYRIFYLLRRCFLSAFSFAIAASTSDFGTRASPRITRTNAGMPAKSDAGETGFFRLEGMAE